MVGLWIPLPKTNEGSVFLNICWLFSGFCCGGAMDLLMNQHDFAISRELLVPSGPVVELIYYWPPGLIDRATRNNYLFYY